MDTVFTTTASSTKKPPRCVDGRPDKDGPDAGPQMLGASLHPIVLSALFHGKAFDDDFVKAEAQKLKSAGFKLGVHTDDHVECGCGFGANLPKIIKRVSQEGEGIGTLIANIYMNNTSVADELLRHYEIDPQNLLNVLTQTIQKVGLYNQIEVSGKDLIDTLVDTYDLDIRVLTGEHAEGAAYVNVVKNTTLATNETAEKGDQLFNLDLWAVVEQASALSVPANFAIVASLVLYIATEMVLVEDKGKDRLQVLIHF